MDTTDPDIVFDENGYCNHCTNAIKRLNEIAFIDPTLKKQRLNDSLEKMKKAGKGKKYDCVIGLSGGVDSSYLAYLVVKQFGLRPLAIHLDNGWNSELAVKNIENIVNILNIDLMTYVVDWNEIKSLQRAYLKASVVDFEVISDNAIVIAINKLMKKHKIKYFISGWNIETESIMPSSWFYSPKYDSLNIRDIHTKYGDNIKLRNYPLLSFPEYLFYRYIKKTDVLDLLNYVDYNKASGKELLLNQLNWRDYGGKHYESLITKFYQTYILPNKFNIDKRRAHLSSLICSNQIRREHALIELKEPLYENDSIMKEEVYFVLKKLGFTKGEFDDIMAEEPKNHFYYKSYNKMFISMRNIFK